MIRTTRPTVILLVSALGLLVSCGETGVMFPSASEEKEVEILAIRDGEMLAPLDQVQVDVVNEAEDMPPDRMTIELRDREDEVIFVQELGEEAVADLPLPLVIPEDLPTGRYKLSITLYVGEEILVEHESMFYVTAEEFAVSGITPYPPVFYPGGEALLIADLDVPDNSDPFLRWRSSGEVVAEGSVSEGSSRIVIDVPDREGVFSVQLELFPVGDEVPPYEILSTIALEAQFFVSANQRPELHELGQEEEYVSLFHFRGETRDWGRDAPAETPDVTGIGDPVLELADQTFGYGVEPGEGFSVGRSILPVGEEGLKSFSLSIRLIYRRPGTLLRVYDEYGVDYAKVSVDEDNTPVLQIGETVSSPDTVGLERDVADELTVSVIRKDGEIRLLWFVSGLLVAEESVEYQPIDWPEEMTTDIGGAGGFAGLLDELGLFSSANEIGDEVDTGVFARAMLLEYGSDLLYAEGFDGTSIPEQISVTRPEDTTSSGDTVERGALVLDPGMRAVLPMIPLSFDTVRIDLGILESLEGVSASFAVAGGSSAVELVRYRTDVGYVAGDAVLAPPRKDEAVRIDLQRRDESFGLISDNMVFELGNVGDDDVNLVVTIENEGVSAPLLVDTLLIVKNRIPVVDGR